MIVNERLFHTRIVNGSHHGMTGASLIDLAFTRVIFSPQWLLNLFVETMDAFSGIWSTKAGSNAQHKTSPVWVSTETFGG